MDWPPREQSPLDSMGETTLVPYCPVRGRVEVLAELPEVFKMELGVEMSVSHTKYKYG